jgi:hypothetical protein
MHLRRRPLYSVQSDVNRTATCVSVHVYERDVLKAGALLHPRLSRPWSSCYFLFLERVLLAAVCVGVLCISWPRQLIFTFPAVHYNGSLRRGPEAVRSLGLRVRIPPGAWMSVVSVTFFQVEVSASDKSLVRGNPTECGVSLICDLETSTRRPRPIRARDMRGDLQR